MFKKICKDCDGQFCCYGKAYMTSAEMIKIKKKTNLSFKKFISIEKVNGKTYFMIKRKSGFCIFFDKRLPKCKIYGYRPIDCKLFPFTLETNKGKLYLTVNRNCVNNPQLINKKAIKDAILLANKFPKKEIIKYARYNIHKQIKKEFPIKTLPYFLGEC